MLLSKHTTHPKDEIEEEEQIFHAFHPALHFTHDALWSAAAHDPNRFEYLPPRCYHCIVIVIIILSILAAGGRAPCIVHVLCCPATSKHAHKAAARRPLLHRPCHVACTSRRGTRPPVYWWWRWWGCLTGWGRGLYTQQHC